MDDDDEFEKNPFDLMPSEIKELCELQDTDRKVFVSVMWLKDDGSDPRFSLFEQY
jgi:hypothetical protein